MVGVHAEWVSLMEQKSVFLSATIMSQSYIYFYLNIAPALPTSDTLQFGEAFQRIYFDQSVTSCISRRGNAGRNGLWLNVLVANVYTYAWRWKRFQLLWMFASHSFLILGLSPKSNPHKPWHDRSELLQVCRNCEHHLSRKYRKPTNVVIIEKGMLKHNIVPLHLTIVRQEPYSWTYPLILP